MYKHVYLVRYFFFFTSNYIIYCRSGSFKQISIRCKIPRNRRFSIGFLCLTSSPLPCMDSMVRCSRCRKQLIESITPPLFLLLHPMKVCLHIKLTYSARHSRHFFSATKKFFVWGGGGGRRILWVVSWFVYW